MKYHALPSNKTSHESQSDKPRVHQMKLFTKYGTRSNEIRRAKREFYFRVATVLGVALFFAMMVLLGRLSPHLDNSQDSEDSSPEVSRDGKATEAEVSRLRAAVDEKIQEFEAATENGDMDPEDLDLLEEAISQQRDVISNRTSSIASKDEIDKLEDLISRRDEHMGTLLLGQSEILEEEAKQAYNEGNVENAIRKLERARNLQKEINASYSHSSSRNPSRLHQLNLSLSEWKIKPIAQKAESLREEAWEAHEEQDWETARQKMEQALEIQKNLYEEHRGSRFASYSKLRNFEQDWDDIRAAEDRNLVKQFIAEAEVLLEKEEAPDALSKIEKARALHQRLVSRFPNIRFAEDENSEHLDQMRDSAASFKLNQAISSLTDKVYEAFRMRNYEDVENLISDLYRKSTQLNRQYPQSRYLDEDRVATVEFLFEKRSMIQVLHALIYGRLQEIPDRTELSMMETEIPQNIFQQITGNNPSNNQGPRLPVESITWEEARAFCRNLSLLLGFRVRLPTKSEFLKCLGQPDRNRIQAQSWNSQNTERSTQPVATSSKNPHGFFDLLGNVAEWIQPPAGQNREEALAIGGSVRDNPLLLVNVPEDFRNKDERNRFIGFRVVVELNNPTDYK